MKPLQKKIKGWVAMFDETILGVFTKNPTGKDTDLLTKVIAQTQGIDYKIVECTITYTLPKKKKLTPPKIK